MPFWWCFLVVGGTLATSTLARVYVSPHEADAGWIGGTERRSCSSWCSCTGSTRSSYCCPPTYNTICGPNEWRPSRFGGPDEWRPSRFEHPCTSRICRDGTTRDGPNGHLGDHCSSHGNCGDNVCCDGRCTTMESCVKTRPRGGVTVNDHAPWQPRTRPCTTHVGCLPYGAAYMCCDGQCLTTESCLWTRREGGVGYPSRSVNPLGATECTTDVGCGRYGAAHICCEGQCTTRSECNPIGLNDVEIIDN